jgi:CDP-diacylglycerol--serine O-phosphatidyltransferase
MLVAAIFPICAAYRLARFNVAHDPKFFVGLPSPVAGVTIGFFPLVVSDFNLVPNWISIPLFIAVALLMVSTIRYSKPQVAMKEKITKSKMILMVLFLFLMLPILGWSKWVWFCYGIVLFYIFAGLIAFVIQTIQEFGD